MAAGSGLGSKCPQFEFLSCGFRTAININRLLLEVGFFAFGPPAAVASGLNLSQALFSYLPLDLVGNFASAPEVFWGLSALRRTAGSQRLAGMWVNLGRCSTLNNESVAHKALKIV